jgi:large subunit ribosomal protein L24
MKIKKGDSVVVIAGKDKGKTGTVSQAFPETEQVIIEGVNIATKHQKNRRTRSQGQIIQIERPVHVSNVALAVDGKPSRVGYRITDGKKERIAKKTGQAV